jgi:predicted AAA+ superfamily ATPase
MDSVNDAPVTYQTDPVKLQVHQSERDSNSLGLSDNFSTKLSTIYPTNPVKIPTVCLSTNCRTDPVKRLSDRLSEFLEIRQRALNSLDTMIEKARTDQQRFLSHIRDVSDM